MPRLPFRRRADGAGEGWSEVGVDAIGVVDLVGPGVADEAAGEVAESAADPGADGAGTAGDFAERLVRLFLRQFENDRSRPRMLRLLRSSFSSARQGRVFYRVLAATVVNPAARATGLHASAMRMELVVGQLNGMAIMRYVLRVEPLASAPVEDVVAQLAPAIRATLKG